MDQIALKEQKKYTTLWERFPEYRSASPADVLTPIFLAYFKDQINKGDRIIDFGCGTGRSITFLSKLDLSISLLDFCDNCLDLEIFIQAMNPKSHIQFFQECLWDLTDAVKPADWILCLDVLEHIPEQKVDNALKSISSRMLKGGLISIWLTKDLFGEKIGEVLHLTIKSSHWWLKKIKRHFGNYHEIHSDKNALILAIFPK